MVMLRHMKVVQTFDILLNKMTKIGKEIVIFGDNS